MLSSDLGNEVELPVPPPPPPFSEGKVGRLWHCACGRSFPSSTRYRKHAKLHNALPIFQCTVEGCGKKYKRKEHLVRHLRQHSTDRPYACSSPGCSKSFSTRQKLARHLRVHDGLRCEECGACFRKRDKLNRHKLQHASARASAAQWLSISEGEPAEQVDHAPQLGQQVGLQCPQCGIAVRNASALERHMSRHRIHKCEKCSATFVRFRDLVTHRRREHPKEYICETCGKVYRREAALRDHERRKHGPDSEAVLMCPHPDCGLCFSSKSNLYTHHRTVHLGLRPHKCRRCGQSFAYRNVLRRHFAVCHKLESALQSETSGDLENFIASPSDRADGSTDEAETGEAAGLKCIKRAFPLNVTALRPRENSSSEEAPRNEKRSITSETSEDDQTVFSDITSSDDAIGVHSGLKSCGSHFATPRRKLLRLFSGSMEPLVRPLR